ncbi:MAG: hypothetical protein AAF617_12965 [Bacteroidota bacterium]
MKHYSIYIAVIVFLIVFSCASDTKKKHDLKKEKDTTIAKDSSVHNGDSHASDTLKNIQLSSKLAEKVARLATLEHNYQLKSLDTIIPQKSILFGSIQRFKDSFAKEIDMTLFRRHVYQIEKAFVKGTKPMYPNDNTYPRAHIEAYIFGTTHTAKTMYDMLKKSMANNRLWAPVTKSPHELFLEENRIYFVRSGGFYMMNIYMDIVEKIKN